MAFLTGKAKPLIAVTGANRGGRMMWMFNHLALKLAGARAIRLTPADDERVVIGKSDGVLLGGGDDIGAELYNGEVMVDVRLDPGRDKMEQAVLDCAFHRDLPVLGVCRGSQMINVFLGGTLHQDIHTVYEEAPKMRTVLPRKWVSIESGTMLRDLLRYDRVMVNSLHHQSVDELGRGLKVAARDDHGIVQAIERPGDGFLMGVQWHPEFLFYAKHQSRLLKALVAAA